MSNDKDLKVLSDIVYSVDKKKEKDNPWQTGDIIKRKDLSQTYKILKTEDNTKNGMQAMAVANSEQITQQFIDEIKK